MKFFYEKEVPFDMKIVFQFQRICHLKYFFQSLDFLVKECFNKLFSLKNWGRKMFCRVI